MSIIYVVLCVFRMVMEVVFVYCFYLYIYVWDCVVIGVVIMEGVVCIWYIYGCGVW